MKFNCHINESGRFVMDDRKAFEDYIASNICKRMTLDLNPYKRAKTPEQNGYFHGVVVPFMAEQMGHNAESPYEIGQVRDYLKSKCGVKSKFAYTDANGFK